MSRLGIAVIVAGSAALLWVGLSAQQEMLPRPGPGSGVTDVKVMNHPTVVAAQSGEWRVELTNVPSVRLAGSATVIMQLPSAAKRGGTLSVTWSTGETERITFTEVTADGWIQVENPGHAGRRWVNLSSARSIEEVR